MKGRKSQAHLDNGDHTFNDGYVTLLCFALLKPSFFSRITDAAWHWWGDHLRTVDRKSVV